MSERKWQIESLRFTAFPSEPQRPQENAWETLRGAPPARRQVRPQEDLIHEAGPLGSGALTYDANPTRIDWRYQPQATDDGPPDLGEFPGGEVLFLQLMKRWLKNAPSLKRIGYGPVLLLPVSSQGEGNAVLNRALPEVEIDQGCRDFFYQVNRRKNSGQVNDLALNRLTRWAVQTFARTRASIRQNGITPYQQEPVYVCRLDLDFNTDHEFAKKLPKTKRGKLLDELSELAVAASNEIERDSQ